MQMRELEPTIEEEFAEEMLEGEPPFDLEKNAQSDTDTHTRCTNRTSCRY